MGLVIGLRSGTSGVAMQFPEWFIDDCGDDSIQSDQQIVFIG